MGVQDNQILVKRRADASFKTSRMNRDFETFKSVFRNIETLEQFCETKGESETHIKAKKRDCEKSEIPPKILRDQ